MLLGIKMALIINSFLQALDTNVRTMNYRYFDNNNGTSYRGWYYHKSRSFQKLHSVPKISIVNVDQKLLQTMSRKLNF